MPTIYSLCQISTLRCFWVKESSNRARKTFASFLKVVSDNAKNKKKIHWSKKDNDTFLQEISNLGIEKISEKLFIQKDIRGFEKESFYIIKPNEKKLWHKAIAYLDVNEFVDAMLRAGKKSYNG